jgi:hypothetical protein
MNATIETHWSRILYCDVFAAGAEMPHPSEIGEGGRRRPGGGRKPATRSATLFTAQRGGPRVSPKGRPEGEQATKRVGANAWPVSQLRREC